MAINETFILAHDFTVTDLDGTDLDDLVMLRFRAVCLDVDDAERRLVDRQGIGLEIVAVVFGGSISSGSCKKGRSSVISIPFVASLRIVF